MYKYSLFFVLTFAFLWSCNGDDDILTGGEVMLEFSRDTLTFDTVFTARGSATRILKIYNTNDRPIRISSIAIGEAPNSSFRMNVDGISTTRAEDIDIAGNDSLYIFGEVTVDPDLPTSESPFVINDEIIFETNGNVQKVILEAWGQNANYIPNRFSADSLSLLTCAGEVTWDSPLPYVLFGAIFLDNCTLNIPAGARIYVHGGLARTTNSAGETVTYNDGLLYILQNGRINVQGTVDNPVIIQGDRLEEEFDDISGQWAGIRLAEGSEGHVFKNVIIKNSIVGIRADSCKLTMENVEIANTAGSGLIAVQSRIIAQNCLFHSASGNAVQLEFGGAYRFEYCTLASYGVDASALSMNNVRCLTDFCGEYLANGLNARFYNSIIFGSRRDEISLVQVPEAALDYRFEDCLVRVDELDDNEPFTNFFDNCDPCLNQTETDIALFVDVDNDDYHLDTLSVVEGLAVPLPSVLVDIENNNRDAMTPDLGCYEYQY